MGVLVGGDGVGKCGAEMSECQYVYRSLTPPPACFVPVEFCKEDGTKYVFYHYKDGYGKEIAIQFCKLVGRKKDVFECLNESEWHECAYYRSSSHRALKEVQG